MRAALERSLVRRMGCALALEIRSIAEDWNTMSADYQRLSCASTAFLYIDVIPLTIAWDVYTLLAIFQRPTLWLHEFRRGRTTWVILGCD
jgi:hypothetical protein